MTLALSVDYVASPRVITVLAPTVFVSVQELIDQIRDSEDNNLDYPHLVNASGKDDLGGGTAVGITMQLQNAKIAFESRGGPAYTQCTIAGGNTVAKDELGVVMDPVQVTAFTQVVLSQSSSPTIVNTDIMNQVTQLKYMIESAGRFTHQGYGHTFFVDPVAGSDANGGETPADAFQTIAFALSVAQDGRGDVIYLASDGVVAIDENVVLDKAATHIRGPGRGVTLQPSSGAPIVINGDNCSISGMIVRAPAGSSEDCITLNGKFARLTKMYVVGAGQLVGTGRGIVIRGGDYTELHEMEVEKCGGSGVYVVDAGLPSGSPREITISGINFYMNGSHGMEFESLPGAPYSSTRLIRLYRCMVNANLGYGIKIDGNTTGVHIDSACSIHNNALGNILDEGVGTQVHSVEMQVWGADAPGSMGKRLKDVKTFATVLMAKG